MRIEVHYSDFTVAEYTNEQDAIGDILEAHAEGILVERINDVADENSLYSLIWTAKLQKES